MILARSFTSKAPEGNPFRQLFIVRARLVRGLTNYNESVNFVLLKKPSVAFQRIFRGTKHFVIDKYTNETRNVIPVTRKITFKSKKGVFISDEASDYGSLPELPRKPPGLFGLFVEENYSKVQSGVAEGKTASDIVTELSIKWKSLSSVEKAHLKRKHDILKEEYKQEVMNFWKGLNTERRVFLEESQGPKLRQLAHARRELLGYPDKPLSPFLLFMQKNAKNVNASSVIERTKILGKKWKEMSADEREVFFIENRKANEQYHHDVAKWKKKHPETA